MSRGPAYDPVATLYDRAFANIEVREQEWGWLSRKVRALPGPPRVLEIGCGTGAVLRALAPHIAHGVGVDVSSAMIACAISRSVGRSQLSFAQIHDAELPAADQSFDVVLSFLSFRYLDWERIWPEICRVLAPGGRFLLLDLVRERARLRDAPGLARAALRNALAPLRHPEFTRALRALTSHPDWAAMLAQHPTRKLDEYQAFFARVLPHVRFEVLDVAPSRRIIALDSGRLGA